jgi:hypothetical protein
MFEKQLKKDLLRYPYTDDELFLKTVKSLTDKIDRAVPYHMGDRFELIKTTCEQYQSMPLFADQFAVDIKENLIWVDYTEHYGDHSDVLPHHQATKRGFLVEKAKNSIFAYFACFFEGMQQWLPGSFSYIIFDTASAEVHESLYKMAVDHLYKKGITYIPVSLEQFKTMKISFFPYPQFTYIYNLFKENEEKVINLIREDQPDITMLNISLIKIYDPEKYKFMNTKVKHGNS